MLLLFRALLVLYPHAFRQEFGSEMLDVLSLAVAESSRKGAFARGVVFFGEIRGLLAGALIEHLRARFEGYEWFHAVSYRRFAMRSEFRYPRAAAPMMLVILAAVLLAIYKARAVYIHQGDTYPMPDLPIVFGCALLLAFLAGAAGWIVVHTLRRSGVHRLSEAQTWPQGK